MTPIPDTAALEALYDEAPRAARDKVMSQITPTYRRWLEQARFLVLATVGPEGCDASPRGDRNAVVRIADERTLLLPDWKGNNRLDSLRNIICDGRVSLMFMVPGCNIVVRVNGTAVVTADAPFVRQFGSQRKLPRTVVVVSVGEIYFQCPNSLVRSRLWTSADESGCVPTASDFLSELETLSR